MAVRSPRSQTPFSDDVVLHEMRDPQAIGIGETKGRDRSASLLAVTTHGRPGFLRTRRARFLNQFPGKFSSVCRFPNFLIFPCRHLTRSVILAATRTPFDQCLNKLQTVEKDVTVSVRSAGCPVKSSREAGDFANRMTL